MLENLKRIYNQETMAERGQRMIPAALYGALAATAYTFAISFVNVYTFPNLPLGMDWGRFFSMWIGFSLGLALFGAIAAWFTEEPAGIVGGGVVLTIIMAIGFLFISGNQNSTLAAQSLITTLPLVGANMLGAWGLRWAAHRHLAIQHDTEPVLRRKQMTRHVLLLTLIGLVPGLLGRMDLPSEQTIGRLHELLQAAPDDPRVWFQLPLRQVPNLQEHFGVEYLLYPRQSDLSAGSQEVTVRFADGYTITCQLPVSSGLNFITECSEGDEFQQAEN